MKEQGLSNCPIRRGPRAGGWGDGPPLARTSCLLPPSWSSASATFKGPRFLFCRRCRVGICTVTRNRREDARGPRKPKNGECAGPGYRDWDEVPVVTCFSGTPSHQGQVQGLRSCPSNLCPLLHTSWGAGPAAGQWVSSPLTAQGFQPQRLLGSSAPLALRRPRGGSSENNRDIY